MNIYSIVLIIVGIIGIGINRKNILLILIIIEMILFASCIILIITSSENNDLNPSIAALFIIALAGSELAVGLTIIIRRKRLRGNSILIRVN